MSFDYSSWFSPLIGTCLLVSAVLAVMPEGGAKRIGAAVASAMLFFAILPGISPDTIPGGKAEDLRAAAGGKLLEAESAAEKETVGLVKEYLEGLIEEKARALALDVEAFCEPAENASGELYLREVTVTYRKPPGEEDAVISLREWIRTILGVPLKRQRHIR